MVTALVAGLVTVSHGSSVGTSHGGCVGSSLGNSVSSSYCNSFTLQMKLPLPVLSTRTNSFGFFAFLSIIPT